MPDSVAIAHLFSDGERIVPIEEGGNIPWVLTGFYVRESSPFCLPVVTIDEERGVWYAGWIDSDTPRINIREHMFARQGAAIAWLLKAAKSVGAYW